MPLYRENADGGIDLVKDNNDGTYTIGNTTYSMENDSVLYTTDADGKITVADGGTGDTTVAENTGTEYFTDELGNIYTQNADGTYALYEGDDASSNDTTVAENTDTEYFTDELGNIYTQNSDGTYALYESSDDPLFADDATSPDDTLLADGAIFEDDTLLAGDPSYYDDYTLADNSDYGDYDFAKRGGLITMMKNGGVPHFEDGGEAEAYMPDGAEDNGDGTFTLGNDVFDMMTGDPLYSMDRYGHITYIEPSTGSDYTDNGDGTYTIGDITYDMETDMPLYSDNINGGVDLAKDNGDGTFSIGNKTYDMQTSVPLYTTNAKTGKITPTYDAIRSPGGGTRTPQIGNVLSEGWDTFKGIGKDALGAITGALGTTAGAAGAGALVATLLGQDFSGGTGAQNQGLDMSKVGVINPRTTDFGIGPTNFIGYDEYGTDYGDYTPNEELLHNLNAPGYNPVNEGDYGYEEVPAEEQAPAMASGGLSSMQTPVASYYTFGQPADILANLGMRQQPPTNPPEMMPQIGQQQPPQPPQQPQQGMQGQQQGMQKQMPDQITQQTPFGAPQQTRMAQSDGMPTPMRRGGLPHVSNVPVVQGRMDFRQGSAVHGEGDGQSDDIPAMLADGEYVIDAETVAQIGNGSTKAGAQALDKFRESIRAHKRSAPVNKIPPKTKALTSYLKGAR
jgi:hypothetical protein